MKITDIATQEAWECSFVNDAKGESVFFKNNFWEIGDSDGNGIAFVFGDDEAAGARARLIAAAPKLIAALIAISADDLGPEQVRALAKSAIDSI